MTPDELREQLLSLVATRAMGTARASMHITSVAAEIDQAVMRLRSALTALGLAVPTDMGDDIAIAYLAGLTGFGETLLAHVAQDHIDDPLARCAVAFYSRQAFGALQAFGATFGTGTDITEATADANAKHAEHERLAAQLRALDDPEATS